jgi:putative intracellular protease/amidase
MKHQEPLIKEALNTGRPILAVCAGAWNLWRSLHFTGKDLLENYTEDNTQLVNGHCNRSGMISLSNSGEVSYDQCLHRIGFQLTPNTIPLVASAGGLMYEKKKLMKEK